ncbi:FMN-dependent NADH-azoreductase [Lactococcus nasutitermitis]|uniref:FMN dependent NADH:quinone oxidoreductase n=1 Tax=Lactococcus nasutitermitis TaxID=1652957 RepID=A0ABV9JDU3_9LACT|nr:FMN-dependent NADH-azoreductase [Lactococcus nasutitermitis]
MSKVLIVKAHPRSSENSYVLRGLDAFISAYKAAHSTDEIEILDVFHAAIPALDEDILSAWDDLRAGKKLEELTAEQQRKLADYDSYAAQFLAADKIVIANPLWNLSIPAKLQQWVETVAVPGKTFRYTENGPVGLASGKKVLHIQASGGVYHQQDLATTYLHTLLKLVGIDDMEDIILEGHMYQPEQAEALSADFVAKIEQAATTF